MGWILGIDTSSVEMGVGLFSDCRPAASYSRYVRNSHAEQISSTTEFLLRSNGLTAADIDRCAIAAGPGSFTGLRIGIAFIKGLFFGRSVAVLPVSSLESLAWAWNGEAASITVAFDARRGEVYWARFTRDKAGLRRARDDVRTSAEEFLRSFAGEDTVVLDTLGYERSTVFNALAGRPRVWWAEALAVQRGLACARAAAAIAPDSPLWRTAADISPNYLSGQFARPPGESA
jgi:tRNA threonylcarbamoyladenosine biosynthesis protein TsaB